MGMQVTEQSGIDERARSLGARFMQRDGATVPRDFGNVQAEYAALHSGAGLLDLVPFGVLRIQGQDRATWLHKLTTGNIQPLAEGRGAHALLLSAKGHVLADFVVLVQPDALVVYTGPAALLKLSATLRRSIFREKIMLADVSEQFVVLSVQGPSAQAVAERALGALPPPEPFQFVEREGNIVVRNSRAGEAGFDLLVPRERGVIVWNTLMANGARPVGWEALNVARLEAGIAWYGDDYDETMLAPEARLEPLIAENKGCYTGQEVIARIKNRGHVNRLLVRLRVNGEAVPERGDRLFAGDQEVGWVTSAVYSPAQSAPLGFGYIRRETAASGTRVQVARGDARIDAVIVE